MTRNRGLPAITTDPTGEHHGGLPTYHWTMAPPGLLTRRQLSAQGLRPGGHPPVAQLRRRGLVARLYDAGRAKPKLPLTPAKLRAVWLAAMARRRCGECGTQLGYIPQQGGPAYGRCWDCLGYPPPDPDPAAVGCPACCDVEWITCPGCRGVDRFAGAAGLCPHCRGESLIPCVLCQNT